MKSNALKTNVRCNILLLKIQMSFSEGKQEMLACHTIGQA